MLKAVMLELLTTRRLRNVSAIEYAVEIGASDMLKEIFNTKGVFRQDGQITVFDITDLTTTTMRSGDPLSSDGSKDETSGFVARKVSD
jgi:hypothetical protein